MTTAFNASEQEARYWVKSQLGSILARNRHAEKRDAKAANDAMFSELESRQQQPLQTTIETALDGWARHAAASNGFGDLP